MTVFRKKVKSPVARDLMWCVEYADGTFVTEFDLETQKPNNLNTIRVTDVIRFGLVGIDAPLYFEVFGGNFNIAGRGISLMYNVDGKNYPLIGKPQMYNNFIAFKRGVSDLALGGARRDNEIVLWGDPSGEVTEYVFGYIARVDNGDVKFNLKAIVTVPFRKPIYMTFTVGADKELNGHLVIYRNNEPFESIEAPLDPELGGEFSWVVR